MLFNHSSQTYAVSVDGVVLASNIVFCGDTTVCAGANLAEGPFTTFFDVFRTATSNDSGAIDNLSISSVPEPATYSLTGVALLAGALLLRRRA